MEAWDVEEPFSLIQTDAKDILDKGALGTERTTHMVRQHLPRSQWTACESRTRLRFLAYSHRRNRTNDLSFWAKIWMGNPLWTNSVTSTTLVIRQSPSFHPSCWTISARI